MAVGGHVGRNPYRTAVALGTWAAANRSYVNGRLLLAGQNPHTLEFRDLVDIAKVLILEVYREMGVLFQEATESLDKSIGDPDTPKRASQPDDQASMAMLMGMMGGSDFRGPKG